jgi:hypothetical protein
MRDVMVDLCHEVEEAIAPEVDPVHRLEAAVRTHVRFHATRTKEVFVGNSELRSLTGKNRVKIIRLRDDYERLFRQIVHDGSNAGLFHVDDSKVATFALLALCTGPSTWFSPRGRLSVDELSDMYTELAFRLLNASAPQPMNGRGRRLVARA